MRKRVWFSLIALALAGGWAFAAAPAATAASTGTVTVVHGIPGLTVDVYVDGKLALPKFKPGTVTAPLTLAAGKHSVKIFPTGMGPSGTPAVSSEVTLPSGANASLVAFLKENGQPSSSVGVFVNDTSTLAAGKARITIRHVAAAPAVKITANGAVLVPSISNNHSVSAVVPAGTYAVAISPAAGGAAVFSTKLDAEVRHQHHRLRVRRLVAEDVRRRVANHHRTGRGPHGRGRG